MKTIGFPVSFILSILLHGVLFSSVIVTSESMPKSFQPMFISLGSIISEGDVATPQAKALRPLTAEMDADMLFLEMSHSKDITAKKESSHVKKVFSSKLKTDQKVYRKASFLHDELDEIQKKEILRQMGIEPDIIPRVPLRLDVQQ